MAVEMRFLRNIKGKTKRDGIRKGKKIIETLKLNILGGKLRNNRMRWYRHIIRMNEERVPKKVLNMKVKGKYPRVRPKSRW
jgi:hypothetical protein